MKNPDTDKEVSYPLRSIYFYLTESCNLRCMHCWIRPSYAPTEAAYRTQNRNNVTVEVVDRVVQEALPLGLSGIKLTGGEPFLNPDLFGFLDVFSGHGLSCNFETNGTLITRNVASRLRDYGVTQISVSLDGSTPELHDRIRGVSGSFARAVAGIEALMEQAIHPQVIFCLHGVNRYDLEETVRFVHGLGVTSFEINPLALMSGERPLQECCTPLPVETLLALEKKVEGQWVDTYPGMHIDLYLPPAFKGMKSLSRSRICACNVLNICGLLSNGDVSICGIGRRKKDLVMGNVTRQSIAEIWKEGPLFREIRQKVPFEMKGICGQCLFKYQCLGFCRSDVLYAEDNVVDAYALCADIHRRGLFPESRILGAQGPSGPREGGRP